MDTLNEEEKKEAIKYLNQNEGMNFAYLTAKLSAYFGKNLSEKYIKDLYLESLF